MSNPFVQLDTNALLQKRISYLERSKAILLEFLEEAELSAKADAMLESAYWYIIFNNKEWEKGRWDACDLIDQIRKKNRVERTNDIINKWSKQ